MEYFDKRESKENCHGTQIVDQVHRWSSKETEKPDKSVLFFSAEFSFTHMARTNINLYAIISFIRGKNNW
jgi:hypothetical protein